MRIELTTYCLRNSCSTPELRWLKVTILNLNYPIINGVCSKQKRQSRFQSRFRLMKYVVKSPTKRGGSNVNSIKNSKCNSLRSYRWVFTSYSSSSSFFSSIHGRKNQPLYCNLFYSSYRFWVHRFLYKHILESAIWENNLYRYTCPASINYLNANIQHLQYS